MTDYPPTGQMVEGYDYQAPISFTKEGWLASGHIPAMCIEDCSASGDVTESVKFWVRRLSFAPPRDLTERYLKEFGAWEDLKTADDETLAMRVLWSACCEISEQGDWAGLIH